MAACKETWKSNDIYSADRRRFIKHENVLAADITGEHYQCDVQKHFKENNFPERKILQQNCVNEAIAINTDLVLNSLTQTLKVI